MRVRTIPQLYEELKRMDPDSAMTYATLRRLIVTGKIPSVRTSDKPNGKYLVTVEALEAYMNGSSQSAADDPAPGYGQIRPVV